MNKPCDCCGTLVPFGKLHKVIKEGKKTYLCSMCYKLNRQNHRKETIKESGIESDLKELKAKADKKYREIKLGREIRNKAGRPKKTKPNKGEIKLKIKKESIALALSKEDKQMLFRKHRSEGMTYQEADSKVTEINEYLKDLGKTLRANRKLTREQADKLFKEEFNKLCYS